MDKNELEQIRLKKEREAEELYRMMQVDRRRRVCVPCLVEPDRVISPYKGPHYVDPYRWVEPLKGRRNLHGDKKPLKFGTANYTTPYDECSGGKEKGRRGASHCTTPN